MPKYRRRWKGPDGAWRYEYDEPKGTPKAAPKLTIPASFSQSYAAIGGGTEEVYVAKLEGNRVRVSQHSDAKYGPEMPVESLPHFRADLAGRLLAPRGAHEAVDAVLDGKGDLLGKGDDGVVWRVGDVVVKVSTTVPYQPFNRGHRTPAAAAAMIKAQVEAGNALDDAGVPGIQRSTFVQAGAKGVQIKPYVEIPKQLTRAQLDAARETVLAMHERGWSLNDSVQVGIETGGRPVLFDIGKASSGATDEAKRRDMERLGDLYREHGERLPEAASKASPAKLFKWLPAVSRAKKLAAAGDTDGAIAELAAARDKLIDDPDIGLDVLDWVWEAEDEMGIRLDSKTKKAAPLTFAEGMAKARRLARRMKWNGWDVSIETDVGEVRHWYDPWTDSKGETTMRYPYGYLRRTLGTDGDHIDVYVGPNEDAPNVYVIDQAKKPAKPTTAPWSDFDEQKVMLGFPDEDSARRAYLEHYDDPRFLLGIHEIPWDVFSEAAAATPEHGRAIRKARYIARQMGPDGRYRYTYPEDRGGKARASRKKTSSEPKPPASKCKRCKGTGQVAYQQQNMFGGPTTTYTAQCQGCDPKTHPKPKPAEPVAKPESKQLDMFARSRAPVALIVPLAVFKGEGGWEIGPRGGKRKRVGGKWVYQNDDESNTKLGGAEEEVRDKGKTPPPETKAEKPAATDGAKLITSAKALEGLSKLPPKEQNRQVFSAINFIQNAIGTNKVVHAIDDAIAKIAKVGKAKLVAALKALRAGLKGATKKGATKAARKAAGEGLLAALLRILTLGATSVLLAVFDDGEKTKKSFTVSAGTLYKAAAVGGKYLRRIPYTDSKGRRRFRYIYKDTAAASRLTATVGEEIRGGLGFLWKVEAVNEDGTVRVSTRDPKHGDSGQTRELTSGEWHQLLSTMAPAGFQRAVERRATTAINAVYRHVPKELLAELTAQSDRGRLAQIEQRAPKVYEKLQAAWKRAGVSPFEAKEIIAASLERRGWDPDARAMVIGNAIATSGVAWRDVIDAAQNLAGGGKVEAKHAAAAAELRTPGGSAQAFASSLEKAAQAAVDQLAKLSALIEAARKDGVSAPAAEAILSTTLASDALLRLNLVADAFPGVKDAMVADVRSTFLGLPAVIPSAPKATGASTSVYVAGEGGKPVALRARYRLVEAADLVASHDPSTFAKHEKYPAGIQERVYHRDKAEQAKVIRNAQKLNAQFVVNTNPDAVNGPPIVSPSGIVLGGNSRAMSMQRAYLDHPERATELQAYLTDHAHEVGFTTEDVAAFKQPVLVREVTEIDESKESLQVLVRQMNESFTQGMDPRAMQVAMGRKLDESALQTLADDMADDDTLSSFLGSKRAGRFTKRLHDAGIIDARNVSQYADPKSGRLNEDGKALVARILVGRVVGDADLLSDTPASTVNAIARAVPYITQARAGGAGFDVSDDLAVALSASNRLRKMAGEGVFDRLDQKASNDHIDNTVDNYLGSLFGDGHPVVHNKRARDLLKVLIRRPGPVQLSSFFAAYTKRATESHEDQGSIFGDKTPPKNVLSELVADLDKKQAKEAKPEVEKKEPEPQAGLFGKGRSYIITVSKGGARGGKYYRRVATGDPKRPWRYYYTREAYDREHGKKGPDAARASYLAKMEGTVESFRAALAEGKLKGTLGEHVRTAKRIRDAHAGSLAATKARLAKLAPEGATILGRSKTLESILGKLVRKPKYGTADNLQDVTGTRVICDTVDDVRATVDKIKATYKILDEDDYITTPQGDYRSHHLIIEGVDGLVKEVQVRTKNQDAFAKWAHDVYKPRTAEQARLVQKHADELEAYSKQASGHYWSKDRGENPPDPDMPPCTSAVKEAIGCL